MKESKVPQFYKYAFAASPLQLLKPYNIAICMKEARNLAKLAPLRFHSDKIGIIFVIQ